MPRQLIDPESGDKKFDARVHIRNNKGQVTQERHYTCTCREGVQVFKDENGHYYADGSDVPHDHLVTLGMAKPKTPKPQQTQAPQKPVAPVVPVPDPIQVAPPVSVEEPSQGEGGEAGSEEDPNPEPPATDDPAGL